MYIITSCQNLRVYINFVQVYTLSNPLNHSPCCTTILSPYYLHFLQSFPLSPFIGTLTLVSLVTYYLSRPAQTLSSTHFTFPTTYSQVRIFSTVDHTVASLTLSLFLRCPKLFYFLFLGYHI